MTAALHVPLHSCSSANLSRAEESATPAHDDGLSAFMSVRPRLFGIAYRMLASAAAAEDIVQDVWVRWQMVDRSVVRDATAFLTTTATRLAINVLQSARSRREIPAGAGLPETVDTTSDAELGAERRQALALGLRILQERLTPTEQAAYILREAFDYAYRDIAKVLRLAEANARQVVTRARQHLASGRRTAATSAGQERLLELFIAAAEDGDLAGLERLIAPDVVSISKRSCVLRSARPQACPERRTDPIDDLTGLRQRVAA